MKLGSRSWPGACYDRSVFTGWIGWYAEQTDFRGAFGRRARRPRAGAGHGRPDPQVHPAGRPHGARSDLDDRLRHPEPRARGVRHALRDRCRLRGPAADGRRPHGRGRRQALAPDAAAGADLPRRQPGARPRLRGEHRPLGQARRHGPDAHGLYGRTHGARRPDDPVPPEEALRAPAGRARQGRLLDLRDHAGAARQDRPVHPGDRDGRQRPVPLQGGRAGGRRAASSTSALPATSPARAARRNGPPVPSAPSSTGSNGPSSPIRRPPPRPCRPARWIGGSSRRPTSCRRSAA